MWRTIFTTVEKPKAFSPHTIYYNSAFSSDRRSVLIESSGRRIEKFLNVLYEINPELIKQHVEKVEIEEDNLNLWAYVFVSEELAKCIIENNWQRITDLAGATDIINSKLEYNLDCLKKLAEELKK